MTNIYLFSGLGADERALQFLTFPKGFNLVFVNWIEPDTNETIEKYALRISQVIDQTKPFILIGLSFGGMMVTEISQFLQAEKIILISSVTCRTELPFHYRLLGRLSLHRLVPKNSSTKANFITYWLFNIETEQEKALLSTIVSSSSPVFTRWAIGEIGSWKRTRQTKNIIRIHGNKDKVLPITNFKPDYTIANGGHFMVVNKAGHISSIINEIINP